MKHQEVLSKQFVEKVATGKLTGHSAQSMAIDLILGKNPFCECIGCIKRMKEGNAISYDKAVLYLKHGDSMEQALSMAHVQLYDAERFTVASIVKEALDKLEGEEQ